MNAVAAAESTDVRREGSGGGFAGAGGASVGGSGGTASP